MTQKGSKMHERAGTLWPQPNPMKLQTLDLVIILGYFLAVILIGLWVSRRGAKDLDSYFLGGKSLR